MRIPHIPQTFADLADSVYSAKELLRILRIPHIPQKFADFADSAYSANACFSRLRILRIPHIPQTFVDSADSTHSAKVCGISGFRKRTFADFKDSSKISFDLAKKKKRFNAKETKGSQQIRQYFQPRLPTFCGVSKKDKPFRCTFLTVSKSFFAVK